jgi:hypothetical protein
VSDKGYIALSRGFFDHQIFADEPFTEREAFQWMIFEAAWKARRVRRGNFVFNLNRGEFAHSERFMATAWQWSRSKVSRFLIKLVKDGMIEKKSNREATHITVCNYDKYQGGRTSKRATTEPRPNHDRTKLEPLNHLTNKPEEEARAANAAANASKYIFEGAVIKLNRENYSRWKNANQNLPLDSVLSARDDWLSTLPTDHPTRKNWFVATSTWLSNKNTAAGLRLSAELSAAAKARPLTGYGDPKL